MLPAENARVRMLIGVKLGDRKSNIELRLTAGLPDDMTASGENVQIVVTYIDM